MTQVETFAERKTWRRALMHDGAVHTSAKLTAWVVVDYVNSKTREAYPSLSTLADERGTDQRTIRRHLATLEGAGYLARSVNTKPGRPVRWWLTFPPTLDTQGVHPHLGPTLDTLGVHDPGHPGCPPTFDDERRESSNVRRAEPVSAPPRTDSPAGAGAPSGLRGRVRPPGVRGGHLRVEVTPLSGLTVLTSAVRETVAHPGCALTSCGLVEASSASVSVVCPPQSVGGLVDALRAAGVVVDDLTA